MPEFREKCGIALSNQTTANFLVITNMLYKFLKFLFLSCLTLIWGGCDAKDDPVAGYGCIGAIQCYNDTMITKSGKTFDIIDCNNDIKYLRHPSLYYTDPEIKKEIPRKNLNIEAPLLGEPCGGITNCKYSGPDICYEQTVFNLTTKVEEQIEECSPAIECPEKK